MATKQSYQAVPGLSEQLKGEFYLNFILKEDCYVKEIGLLIFIYPGINTGC